MYYIIQTTGAQKATLITRHDYHKALMTNQIIFEGDHEECIDWMATNTDATLADADIENNASPVTFCTAKDILGLDKK